MQLALENLHKLHRIRAFIKGLVEQSLKFRLFPVVCGIEQHLLCPMLRISGSISLKQGFLSFEDRLLLVDHRIAADYLVKDGSQLVSSPIDQSAPTLDIPECIQSLFVLKNVPRLLRRRGLRRHHSSRGFRPCPPHLKFFSFGSASNVAFGERVLDEGVFFKHLEHFLALLFVR